MYFRGCKLYNCFVCKSQDLFLLTNSSTIPHERRTDFIESPKYNSQRGVIPLEIIVEMAANPELAKEEAAAAEAKKILESQKKEAEKQIKSEAVKIDSLEPLKPGEKGLPQVELDKDSDLKK